MLEISQRVEQGVVWFFDKELCEAGIMYGKDFGLSVVRGPGDLGYMMRMSAVGVVFQLTSQSLDERTPKHLPTEYRDFKGIDLVRERFSKSTRSGIVIAVDGTSVVWVHDNKGLREMGKEKYRFDEGYAVVR